MAESDKDKTSTYGSSNNQKTSTYNEIHEVTAAYSGTQKKHPKSQTHGIQKGDKITLKGKEYLVTGIISNTTYEAIIYKIEDDQKNVFALKLYFEYDHSRNEPNKEALERIMQISNPDILKLYDFAVNSNDKFQNRYCYEISDFAYGGDIQHYIKNKKSISYNFIENEFIPQVLKGLKILHRNKIYHCDLKPSNIFFIDAEKTDIVIGDYGSSKAYDINLDKEVTKSSTVIGTNYYMAPEQPRGFISEKLDYYSLGIILLQMIYPDEIACNKDISSIDKRKFETISERQFNQKPILHNFNPSYKRVNKLIEGLTLFNPHCRWGKAEIEKWLKGKDVDVKYRETETNLVQPVKLGYATIRTPKDLIEIIETRNTWWEDLFEDADTYFAIKAWISSYQDISTRKKFDQMIHYYKPMGKAFVKESAIRFFDPKRDIRIDMNVFNFFTSVNIKEDVEAYISLIDEIWKFTSIEKIRFYLFQLEFSLLQLKKNADNDYAIFIVALLDKIYNAFGVVQKPHNNYTTLIQTKISLKNETASYRLFMNLFYIFNHSRSFRDNKNNEIKTPEAVGLYFVQNEALFYDKRMLVEKEAFFIQKNKKALNTLHYKQFVFELFKDQAETYIEMVSLRLDRHRYFQVNYKYYKSLNAFLSSKKINKDFTSRSSTNEQIGDRRNSGESFRSTCNHFISNVCAKHNIATLTRKNISQIRRKFRRESKIQYMRLYAGQFLALIIAILLILIIYGIATNKLNINDKWEISWDIDGTFASENNTVNNTSIIYKANKTANVRAAASIKSSVVSVVFVGEKIEVTDTTNPQWYKVKIETIEGYISSKLLTYSDNEDN